MKKVQMGMLFGAAITVGATSTWTITRAAEPSYKGDPAVYKVIFEDANFRVIESNRPAGVTDKPHGHPLPSINYAVTDYKTRITDADGKTRESIRKAGTASAGRIVVSHTATNIGTTNCKEVFVEKK